MEFSDSIKQLRKDNKLTQEQLASKLHVTRQAISNWENNKNLPDIETLIEIATTFHISLDQLILGGLACFIIKSLSVEYIDAKGILHENFFLIPVGFAFLATGILVIVVTLGAFLYNKKRLSK